MSNDFLGRRLSRAKPVLVKIARAFGLEVRPTSPASRDDLRLAWFLADQSVETLLDVGANKGQFAEGIFASGFSGHIVSFEALPGAHAELVEKAARAEGRWTVAPALALSDRQGITEFNVNDADTTSSLLRTAEQSLEFMPGGKVKSMLQVETRRLDDFDREFDFGGKRTFLKIDVQGGEGLVLAGAESTLGKVVGIVVELSFTELYAGQPLAMDVLNGLLNFGFEVHDISAAYRDPVNYKLHQVDVVLFHPERRV